MDLLTEPVIKQPRRAADTHSAIEWLDALAAGACDRETFIRGVNDILQRAPDAGWELLALLDQYYRRGRIGEEAFSPLKAHLQRALMGKNRGTNRDEQDPAPRRDHAVTSPASAASPPPPASAPSAAIPAPHISVPATTGPVRESALIGAPQPSGKSLAPGEVLRNRYRIVGLLGRGGMGAVFEAVDEFRLDRSNGEQKVAIKVLHDAVIQRPRLFAELRREFQHLQSLSHPNIVRVHEFDRDGDTAFFTMEYLSGELLSRVLAGREYPLHRPYALAIVRDVGAAVVHAHARGIVHGDLNPGNIFITDGGEVRVLDFGASYQLRRGPWISEFEPTEQPSVATPSYASCELLEGEVADARDDVYALGCIMYVLLTGEHPFEDQSALRARTLGLKPKRPNGLNHRTWNALREALEFKRENRPGDVQSWLNRLDLRAASPTLPPLPTLVETRRRSGRGSGSVVIGALIALLLASLAWWASTHADALPQSKEIVERVKSAVAQLANRFSGAGTDATGTVNATATVNASGNANATGNATSGANAEANGSAGAGGGANHSRNPDAGSDVDARGGVNASSNSVPDRNAGTGGGEVSAPHADALSADAPSAPPAASQDAPPIASVQPQPVAEPPREQAPTSASSRQALGAGSPSPPPYRARIELSEDNVDVTLDDTVARVIVRRSRLLRGDATFSWWTESGTAKPGRDFIPVKAHEETLTSGKSSATLFIPILPDAKRRDARSFYVVIDASNDNAAVGPRTLTQVTIPGSD